MEFKQYTLKDIATVQTGPFGSQLHKSDYIENGTPIITVEHLGENQILHHNLPGVKKEDVKRLYKYSLKENDIVFSRVGSVDRRAIVSTKEDGWLFSGRCLRVRVVSELVDPIYLSYFFGLPSFKEHIRNIAVGATMPSINTKILSDIKVKLPDIITQNRISEILHSLDSKIWLNNEIIKNLEELAQTLFKHWFVDFEFPNEEGEPYKSSGGEMIESEKGLIPKGFLVQLLAESTEFLSGGTPKTKVQEYWGGEIPFFTPKDITGSVYVTQTLKTITEQGLSESNSKLYPKDTIFITARGTVGKLNIGNVEMAMNQSCFAMKQKQGFQFFLYFMLETLLRQIIQGSNGAVFNAINLKDLNILRIVKPMDKLIADFEGIVIPLFNLMSEKEKENIAIKEMRDTLLPKLLLGELGLSDELKKELNNIGT